MAAQASTAAAIEAVFAAGGVLSRAAPAYLPRPGQLAMAEAIRQTIEHGGTLVVEAGTGVGKTYAYLVPVLLSGERALLSTATKALQDQLYGRDLPELLKALNLPVRTAQLKGRSSYVCHYRLERARWDTDISDASALRTLARIEEWVKVTRTGDLAELPGLDERSPQIPLVTSTRENCLGSQCPQAQKCHVNQARREAMAADVVVVNHHLMFADLAVRESGVAELLPSVRVAIFDEAHQLQETGVQFLGAQLSTGQIQSLASDVLSTGQQAAAGLADWAFLAAALEDACTELRWVAAPIAAGVARAQWQESAPEGVDPDAWLATLRKLQAALDKLASALQPVCELGPEFTRLLERTAQASQRLERFMLASPGAVVRWLDAGAGQVRLVEAPLDIAQALRSRLLGLPTPANGVSATDEAENGGEGFSDVPPAEPAEDRVQHKALVFTSATLGVGKDLSWFTESCGLEGAQQLKVDSPFDYAHQAALYVPLDLPQPADPAHSAAVAQVAADAAQQLGGRTLVLTTTLRALQVIGKALRERLTADQLAGAAETMVLVQGELPKRQLVERFRLGGADGRPGCVMVASASFWEGMDVPGDALELVVIDKLPFPPPGDPLVAARARHLESQGRKPFMDYFVPEAAVALKQGAGRLIRRESDHGVLVVCDARLVEKGYGRKLRAALPPMPLLKTPEAFAAALEALNTRRERAHTSSGDAPSGAPMQAEDWSGLGGDDA
ncbi:ATP-dependent DNA helicase [Variovorax sp. HJSM1_2]|uniref:ATP-dependent DNA helicase n=1 Tax=Variovorax sp. HJSM1_2 TaxID=3366263 RepID=UPI003BE467B6